TLTMLMSSTVMKVPRHTAATRASWRAGSMGGRMVDSGRVHFIYRPTVGQLKKESFPYGPRWPRGASSTLGVLPAHPPPAHAPGSSSIRPAAYRPRPAAPHQAAGGAAGRADGGGRAIVHRQGGRGGHGERHRRSRGGRQ